MSGFPRQVQTQPAPAVSGDFCSANPYFSVNAGQGAFVAGASLQVGRFCWVDPTNAILNNSGSGLPTGFVGRNQQGVITQFLAEFSNQIVPGTQCMCFSGGDFWMLNSGLLAAAVGMKAYALFASGLITFAPTGTPPGLASGSSSSVAPETFSLTGSIAVVSNPVGTLQANTGNEEFGVLSVPTTPASGTVYPGATITGTGVQAGTKSFRSSPARSAAPGPISSTSRRLWHRPPSAGPMAYSPSVGPSWLASASGASFPAPV